MSRGGGNSSGGITIVLALALAFGGLMLFANRQPAEQTSAATPTWSPAWPTTADEGAAPPARGQIYELAQKAEALGCYPSAATLDNVMKLAHDYANTGVNDFEARAHDDAAFKVLVAQALVLSAGTHVRILSADSWNGRLNVEVRTGNHAGERCWYLSNVNILGRQL